MAPMQVGFQVSLEATTMNLDNSATQVTGAIGGVIQSTKPVLSGTLLWDTVVYIGLKAVREVVFQFDALKINTKPNAQPTIR